MATAANALKRPNGGRRRASARIACQELLGTLACRYCIVGTSESLGSSPGPGKPFFGFTIYRECLLFLPTCKSHHTLLQRIKGFWYFLTGLVAKRLRYLCKAGEINISCSFVDSFLPRLNFIPSFRESLKFSDRKQSAIFNDLVLVFSKVIGTCLSHKHNINNISIFALRHRFLIHSDRSHVRKSTSIKYFLETSSW